MNKHILVIGLSLALGSLSTTAFAADTGDFYIGAGVGQAKWHVDTEPGARVDDSGTAADVRFGYVWHWSVDFAVEGGYVDLGKYTTDYSHGIDTVHDEATNRGVFAGVKVKYRFDPGWYLQGRAGLYQGRIKAKGVDTYMRGEQVVDLSFSYDYNETGWYAGVGAGHDFGRHFGLGLDYDYYHVHLDGADVNVGAVTVGAEYRF